MNDGWMMDNDDDEGVIIGEHPVSRLDHTGHI